MGKRRVVMFLNPSNVSRNGNEPNAVRLSLQRFLITPSADMMISKRCRWFIIVVLVFYLIALVMYTNLFLFQKCFKQQHRLGNTVLELNFQLKKVGERNAYLDRDQRFKEEEKLKMADVSVSDKVNNKEIIVINKKEFESGVAISVEDYHKLYDSAVSSDLKKDMTKEIERRRYITSREQKSASNQQDKYIFSLRYYEQLSMATKNLLSLASLATHTNRRLVMPFVNNSRFSGLRLGVSMSRFIEASKYNRSYLENDYHGGKFSSMDKYFDVNHLNRRLQEHGYTSLAPFDEFQSKCRTLDVVIHFLYVDDYATKNIEKWYKLPRSRSAEVIKKARINNGWIECDFVKRSEISKLLGNINVTRYVCVDPEVIRSVDQLEKTVLKNSQCVGIILWKGNGTKRTHFPLAPTITEPIRPSHLKHDRRLIDIAYRYIRDVIKRPFISVHVRSERHLMWRGIKAALACIKKLNRRVFQRKMKFNLKKIFLATDLEEHGSDTLILNSNSRDRSVLQAELMNGLEKPFRFHPNDYGLFDRGEIAIVEMHILSLGESLFTLGRGNFQEWISELFLLHNAEDKSLIYKVCSHIK